VFLPKEVKSCNRWRTYDVNLDISQPLYGQAAARLPRIAQYGQQLGMGEITTCYDRLELVDTQKECKKTKGTPWNNKYCAAIQFDEVLQVGGVEVMRIRRKSEQNVNPLAHPSLRGKKTYELAMKQVGEQRKTLMEFDPEHSSSLIKAAVNVHTVGFNTQVLQADALTGNSVIQFLVRERVQELRKAYQAQLVQALLNPIPTGNAEFEFMNRKLKGVEALADSVVQIAYPRSVIAYGDALSFRFGDVELSKLDKNAVPAFVAGQSYPDLLNLGLTLKSELDAGPITRATILPPLDARAAVGRYQGLLQRQPEIERFPVLDEVLQELRAARSLLQ
jgi:hypothetical protein